MAEQDGSNLGVLAPESQKKSGGFGGFFGGGKTAAPDTGGIPPGAIGNVVDEVNNASRRVRILEDRYQNVRSKLQIIEQNLLDNQKKASSDKQSVQDDLMRMKRAISDQELKTDTIIKELLLCAKKEDVDVLTKYLDFWEPVHFVTREQAERMIKDAIEISLARISERIEQ